MAKLEVSLSRLHKLAERLKTLAEATAVEALTAGRAVHLAGSAGEPHLARLKAQGPKAMELLEKSERYARLAAELRAVIGRSNQERGINDLMAQQAAVAQILMRKQSLLEHAKTSAGIPLSEVSSYKPFAGDDAHQAIAVKVMTEEHQLTLEAGVSRLQREAYLLADRIAEANAPRVEIELDDDIVGEVTGR